MGNIEKIIDLFVMSEEWDEAFVWVEKHPEFKEIVYVPYARSLAEQDKFLQAQNGKLAACQLWADFQCFVFAETVWKGLSSTPK